jgi:hypothetical protein
MIHAKRLLQSGMAQPSVGTRPRVSRTFHRRQTRECVLGTSLAICQSMPVKDLR